MEFGVLKQSGGLVKQWSPFIFIIEEDEFYYKKKINEENYKRYHISYLKEVYIQKQVKEKPDYILVIDLFDNIENNKKDTFIKLAEIEGKSGTLSQIKKILNVKRLQYDLNLFLYKYKEKMDILLNNEPIIKRFEEETKANSDKIINALKKNEYLTKNINTIIPLFNERLNNFVKLLNQNDFNANLLDEETINKIKILLNNNFNFQESKKFEKNLNELEYFKRVYINLIKLFSQIKFCFILKKYKLYDKKYLLEKQKVNEIAKNDNSKEALSLNDESNGDTNEIKEENNINQNKDNIEIRLSKKKEQNDAYKSRILTALNSNTKMKDNLKNMILTQNKKLFFCLVCNTLLEKTLLDKATCHFDSKCTTRSFFFCRKCKIHFCTKCVVYQRGLKCFQNHKYFPKPVNAKEESKCFLCNNIKAYPFYECKYCKEQICSDCLEGVNVRQNSCQNCNNELIWKKCLFTECDKCHKLSECFYFCICCDNSICLNCSNNPKGKCGALHDLEKIELNSDKPDKDILFDNKKRFSNYYEALIDGKCSLCNITIGKNIVWACLRCSLFLCDKCFKRMDEN